MMTGLTGRVLREGDPGWDVARRDFNTRVDYSLTVPRYVVFCQETQDVVNAVRWTRESGVPLRARSGRHSYEAYAQVRDGVIVDVSDMDAVSIDREAGTAVIGAGVYMLELYEKLWDAGYTLPAATGASVGIAGLVLGGGVGPTSRKFGLTADNLLEVELVLADGSVVRANAEEHPDLFWACRGGGGGNFGIATSFKFRLRPINLVMAFNITWEWDAFHAVVDRWQDWAFQAEDALGTFLRLSANEKITLFGVYAPDDPRELPRAETHLRQLFAAASPSGVSMQVVPYVVAMRMFAGVDLLHPSWLQDPHSDRQIYKSTSAFARQRLPREALDILEKAIRTSPQTPGSPNQPNMVQLLGGGGAAARVASDATATFYRDAHFLLQYDAYWTAPEDAEENLAWVRDLRKALLPWASGAYVNYHNADLEDYMRDYYGDNAARLVQVKRQYDPEDVFRFPQSIPLSLPGSSSEDAVPSAD